MEGDGRMLFKQDIDDSTRQAVEFEPNDPVADQMGAFAMAIRGEIEVETDGEVGMQQSKSCRQLPNLPPRAGRC